MKIGTIGWVDLTVPNADELIEFYRQAVGWEAQAHAMGDYSDYGMIAPEGKDAVSGICHAKGPNADLPPYWLIYIIVADVHDVAKKCEAAGGKIIQGPRNNGSSWMCVMQDPAGAYFAVYQEG